MCSPLRNSRVRAPCVCPPVGVPRGRVGCGFGLAGCAKGCPGRSRRPQAVVAVWPRLSRGPLRPPALCASPWASLSLVWWVSPPPHPPHPPHVPPPCVAAAAGCPHSRVCVRARVSGGCVRGRCACVSVGGGPPTGYGPGTRGRPLPAFRAFDSRVVTPPTQWCGPVCGVCACPCPAVPV